MRPGSSLSRMLAVSGWRLMIRIAIGARLFWGVVATPGRTGDRAVVATIKTAVVKAACALRAGHKAALQGVSGARAYAHRGSHFPIFSICCATITKPPMQ